jgi:plastocyanin
VIARARIRRIAMALTCSAVLGGLVVVGATGAVGAVGAGGSGRGIWRSAGRAPHPAKKKKVPNRKPAPQTAPLPLRTGVDEGEYYLTPTHPVVGAGTVEFDPVNVGMDEHNMTITDSSGHVLGSVDIAPGQTQQLDVKLAPGTYKLFCNLYNHAALGMIHTLTVR